VVIRRGGAVAAIAVVAVAALVAAPAHAKADLNVPDFVTEPTSGSAEVSYAVVDPLTMDLRLGIASGPGCAGPGAGANCSASVADLARAARATVAVNANYTDSHIVLGTVISNHQALSAPNPHTTTLCIGDRPATGRPGITLTKTPDPAVCLTAVSGEQVVAAGKVAIEGTSDEGDRTKFWWSVGHPYRVERTLVGVRPDLTLLFAVATSNHPGGRDGMTVPEAANWLLAHGVTDAIALDGGHMANAWAYGRGNVNPLERGQPPVRTALLAVPRVWHFNLAPVPTPVPTPTVAAAEPGAGSADLKPTVGAEVAPPVVQPAVDRSVGTGSPPVADPVPTPIGDIVYGP